MSHTREHSGLFDLRDEVIVITGGAGFLGLMHAEAVLEAGGVPVLLDINEKYLEAAEANFESKWAGRAVFAKIDITNRREVEQALNHILERLNRVDGLINNAANNPTVTADGEMTSATRFENLSLDQWHNDLETGLTGAFLCAQIFGSLMAQRGKGVIVNICSDFSLN